MCDNTTNNSKSRGWTFTDFAIQDKLVPDYYPEIGWDYLVYALEYCPSTNRPHYQGYMYFSNGRYFNAIKKKKGYDKMKLIPSSGSPEQNRTYIVGPYDKDGKHKDFNPNHLEYGKLPKQGKRVDLDEIKDQIMNDEKTVEDIIVEQPIMYHQYGRTLEKLEVIKLRKQFRNFQTIGIWLHGPTGTGKSEYAYRQFNSETHYELTNDNGWWDGYKGQPIVIINDFRGWIPYDNLLQLVDKHPCSLPRLRNVGTVPFLSRVVIITSALSPEQCYNKRHENDSIEQLNRRFMVIQTNTPQHIALTWEWPITCGCEDIPEEKCDNCH